MNACKQEGSTSVPGGGETQRRKTQIGGCKEGRWGGQGGKYYWVWGGKTERPIQSEEGSYLGGSSCWGGGWRGASITRKRNKRGNIFVRSAGGGESLRGSKKGAEHIWGSKRRKKNKVE